MPRHVRKGDTVIVTAGDHKGQTGVVTRVIPDADRVLVQGVNLRTRHMRPSRTNPQGGVVTREAPIHISNVSPVVDGRATRVRFETAADGSKSRVAARGGKTLGQVHGARDRSERPAGEKPAAGGAPGKKKKKAKTKKKTALKAAGGSKKTASKKKTTKTTTSKKKKTAGRSKSES